MKVGDTPDRSTPVTAMSAARLDAGDVQINEPWLTVARLAWMFLFVTNLWYSVVALGIYHRQALHPCPASSCLVSPAQAASLRHAGISLGRYADFSTGVGVALTLIGAIMALALFVRRSNSRIALAVGVLLFTFSIGNITAGQSVTLISPVMDNVISLTNLAISFSVFMTFPDGRFVPRWTWLLVLAWVLLHWALNTYPTVSWLYVFYPMIYLGALVVQIFRYLRVSTARRRQQTKLVVLAFIVTLVGNILYWIVLPAVMPMFRAPGSLYPLIAYPVYLTMTLILPISLAIAIQRHRLFDVDILVNRTLVYGSLTTVLALIYFASIAGFQALAQALTGTTTLPAVVIVTSTLIAVALFRPLRRRIQTAIDRRFYRRKYDAAKTLASFSAVLRQQVDLSELRGRLVEVVAETMQPAQVSLWLREPSSAAHAESRAPLPAEPGHEGGKS